MLREVVVIAANNTDIPQNQAPKATSRPHETSDHLKNDFAWPRLCEIASLQDQSKARQFGWIHQLGFATNSRVPRYQCNCYQNREDQCYLLQVTKAKEFQPLWSRRTSEVPGLRQRDLWSAYSWDKLFEWRSCTIPCKTRVPANSAWLAAESTEVKTTVFMNDAMPTKVACHETGLCLRRVYLTWANSLKNDGKRWCYCTLIG